VQPIDVFVSLDRTGGIDALRERIARLDDAGVAGVMVSDHLFVSLGPDRNTAYLPDDPIVVLAAVAALSSRLVLGTLVANVGLLHPALVLRHFAQLAKLVGGERVLAGIGAGWNTEEFAALGIEMPPHGARLDRLEESCRLARALFAGEVATLEGAHVVARGLPLAPRPTKPPRIFVGGGSDRLLDIGGRYADVVDLNGTSRAKHLGRTRPLRDDRARRRGTTVDDLVASAARVRSVAAACGRPSPRFSITLDPIAFGNDAPAAPDCPYLLAGDVARVRATLEERAQRIGFDAIVVPESTDLETLCAQVLR
jgi:alkanesulfonate monooxygenase SsuD/methylene tetrahydromethanopterin reductase-like flavin-dependent oxidoreductase (luciferase family)